MTPSQFMSAPARISPDRYMSSAPRLLDGSDEWASKYARELRGVIIRQATFAPRSLQAHLGPSEIGESCDRQIVGKLIGVQRTNHVSDPWPSIVGTAVHAWLAIACNDDNERERFLRWITEAAVEPAPGYGGHADLYDITEKCVVDWKILGPSSLAKIKSSEGPPRRYKVQLLLYGRGYRNLGLPVHRVVIAALPRTASTLDGMYIWSHNCGPDDDILVNEVLDQMIIRQAAAQMIREGRLSLREVRATPSDESCFFLKILPLLQTPVLLRQRTGLPGNSPPEAVIFRREKIR